MTKPVALVLFALFAAASGYTNYPHYESTAQYHCQDFRNTSKLSLSFWYTWTRGFISGLSLQIPKEVLDDDKVTLDLDGLKQLWNEHRSQVLNVEKWWLTLSIFIVVLSLVFTIFYLSYCLCMCCCVKKTRESSSSDTVTRLVLNFIIVALVILNVLALVALFISNEDARSNASHLPDDANRCISDVDVYKNSTDDQVRKLLVTDFKATNASVIQLVDDVVQEAQTYADAAGIPNPLEEPKAQIISAMNSLAANFETFANDISRFLQQTNITQDTRPYIEDNRDSYEKAVRIAWWIGLAMGIIFAVVTALFLPGVLFGFFGSQPSYNNGCCVASTGSWFYRGSIIISAIVMIAFAVGTAMLMYTGAGLRFYVCAPLEDPLKREDFIKVIDKYVQPRFQDAANTFNVTLPTTTEILEGCSANENATLYTIFHMDEDVNRFLQQFNDTLQDVIEKAAGAAPSGDLSENALGLAVPNPKEIEQLLKDLVGNVTEEANGYKDHINKTLVTELTSCAPIREIAANVVSATCEYMVDPFNGVWLALIVSIIVTIVLSFVSTCASKVYQRRECHVGPRIEDVLVAWDAPIAYESVEKSPKRKSWRPQMRLSRPMKRQPKYETRTDEDPWSV